MKTILKVILPVLAFTLASATAVSTNEAKIKESKKDALIVGYVQNASEPHCEAVEVDCTVEAVGPVCMTSEFTPRQAFAKNNSNACTVSLYRFEN